MPADFDVVVAGYVGVDMTPGFPAAELPLAELLRPGKLVEVGPLELSPGGVVANTGLALSRFGNRVALMALVGEDPLGDLLLGMLDGHGAALHLRRTRAAGTAYGIVLAPPGMDRVFLEYPGCNATFTARDIDLDLVARCRLFHFGYPPLMPALLADEGAELVSLFSRVRELGVATSLDMTLPDPAGPAGKVDWRRLLTQVLPHVDIFVPSVEELLYMLAPEQWARLSEASGPRDIIGIIPDDVYVDLAVQAAGMGATVVLIKAGSRGGYLHTGAVAGLAARTGLPLAPAGWDDQRLWLPAFPVDPARVQNACGAGDAAVAGFLTAILRGESAASAGRMAMLAGRDSLYGVDTTSGLQRWAAMIREAE